MPIIKCPKCGEEYDSMYIIHSCKNSKKSDILGNFLKISFWIYILVVIVLFLYTVLFLPTENITENVEISFLGGLIIAIFIILPLYLFKERLPIIKINTITTKIRKLENIYLFTRKNFLLLLPLILLILYFLYPFLITIPTSLSQAKAEKCFEDCWGFVSFCEKKCSYNSPLYSWEFKGKIGNTSSLNLFFEYLTKNSSPYYQKIFHSQNIIIILLGLILYYGIIFGVSIIKKLEKQAKKE